jgi:hypothetical protein
MAGKSEPWGRPDSAPALDSERAGCERTGFGRRYAFSLAFLLVAVTEFPQLSKFA